MEKRKGQNSILFLTTLGVYLGLVLVGGTPQVLANAATTRHFDIKDEIEFQDKLDKDPDLKPSQRSISDAVANAKQVKFVPLVRLLKQFGQFLPISVFHSTAGTSSFQSVEIARTDLFYDDSRARASVPRFSGLTVNHLARSSIEPFLVGGAK